MAHSNYQWQPWIIGLMLCAVGITAWVTLPRILPSSSTEEHSEFSTLREQLIQQTDSLSGNWLHTLNPLAQTVQGDLVWNTTRQTGVMRLSNLAAAKPSMQYQLWIFDTKQPSDKPILGATFTQGAEHNVLWIPIRPTTPLVEPYKFELHLTSTEAANPSQLLLMVQP